jgi:hypothetical protein
MLSRALSLATVMLLIGGFAAAPVRAQNLEAGKSPSQIFGGTCAACHKSPRGLLKTVAPGSLPGFLRQHYTTSSEMASVLSGYLVSSGAADTRYTGTQSKQGKDARQEPSGQPTQLDRYGRPIRRAPTQEASRPDADGRLPQAEPPVRQGRTPAAAGEERGPDGRRLSAKQRLSKRGKPGEELPKTDAAKTDAPMGEAAKGDASKDEKPNAVSDEASKPEVKPEDEKSESAKLDAGKADGNGSDVPLRADPVPAVTPAPKSAVGEDKPALPAAPASGAGSTASPGASTAASNAVPEAQEGGSASVASPSAAVSVSPPPAPVAPAGPPAPPISQ